MPTTTLLFASLTLVTLVGCERIEQARQRADEALREVRQKAAGMLGEASDYLGGQPPASDADAPVEDSSVTAL
jgi:hypothetical protein